MDSHLINIVSEINQDNCILILGPDIIDFGQKSFFETMFDEFLNDDQYKSLIDKTQQYIFVNEDLVELQPGAKETTVRRMMERFYEKQKAFEEPLTKISQIPFHLIISLLPDKRLQNIFKDQKLDFDYSHYPREEHPVQVEKPTQKKPLIYNLLGDFRAGDVIITFDHLFAFLSGIMGKRELPQNIQEALKKARTFIFLGVHFEKWYVQLLLRIITVNDKKEKEKYTILKNGNTNDVCMFIARRLELEFLPSEPLNFLDELYDECKKQNVLKIVPPLAIVFISYSHKDKASTQLLISRLKENNIKVVVDDIDMRGGEKINDFIARITAVDIIIPIVSANSLISTWVIKEISTTLDIPGKNLLPCSLDESLLDKNFIENAEKIVDEHLRVIDEKIRQRGKNDRSDLFSESNDWSEYFKKLPLVFTELKQRKYIPADNADLIVEEIKKIMKLK